MQKKKLGSTAAAGGLDHYGFNTDREDQSAGGTCVAPSHLGPTDQRFKIYEQDATMRNVEPGTPFTNRINVSTSATKGQGHVNLTITDVQLGDEVDFICLIKSLTDGSGEGRTQLRIGSCEAKNGYPKPNITWYKDNTPLVNIPNEVSVVPLVTTESSGLLTVKSELRLNVVKRDKDSEFYCEVNYLTTEGSAMKESKKIKINVNYKLTFWVESPKGDIKEGDTVELLCEGNGNPQPNFSFKRGEGELQNKNNMLVLMDVRRKDSGTYKCITGHPETFEDIVGNVTLFVNYLDPAVVSPDDTHMLLQGEELNASCNALSSLDTHTVWKKNGVTVATGNILSLRDVVYDTAGTYECLVTVPQLASMETSRALQLIVEGPPEVRGPETNSLEEAVDSMVVLICSARGYPTPAVNWTTSEELIDSEYNVTEDVVVSKVSFKVTSDMNVTCHVSNLHGNKEVLFSIKAIMPTTDPPPTTPSRSTVMPTTDPPPTTPSRSTVMPTTDPPPTTPSRSTESSGVIIAVLIICLLLLAVLGSGLYFLYKKGKICGRSGKQDLTKEKTSRDNIVVEMKSDNTEEAVLLAVNGDKKPPGEQ
ncbi:hypothetical protein CRUP_020205 [Coryphaenoides rupestris]|nr:hypothetical protein CRUP_020205 [Coryphaenoides rupestris]